MAKMYVYRFMAKCIYVQIYGIEHMNLVYRI